MSLINTLKQKLSTVLKPKSLDTPIYLDNGAAFVCQDHVNDVNMRTSITAKHIGENVEDFPKFLISKTSSRDGMIGMHHQIILNLDTDNDATEGSKNLLTSGTIFDIVMVLQTQIDELRAELRK